MFLVVTLAVATPHVKGDGNAPTWWKSGMPPYQMPELLMTNYTMDGQIPIAKMYVDDSNGGMGTHYTAEHSQIQNMIFHFTHMLQTRVDLKWNWFFSALKNYPVKGKSVAVYGSMEPTVESALLAHGAIHVTTIEYNQLTYDHPQLSQVKPSSLSAHKHQFDAAVSLSSFDHDGLGRYGDPIDPDGDLKAMLSVRNVLNPSGLLFLTVPVGPDVIVWNLHRRYGRLRLPRLLQGWHVVDRFGWDDQRLNLEASWRRGYEPVHVLRPLPLQTSSPGHFADRHKTKIAEKEDL